MARISLRKQPQASVKDALRRLHTRRKPAKPALVQEASGIRVGISANLPDAARHGAYLMAGYYRDWLERDRLTAWGRYKQQHFVIAVGGGNTIKAQYQALVAEHHSDIDWIKHVRFFFLEESSGEQGWESAENALVINFIVPLARKLIGIRGLNALGDRLGLTHPVDEDDIIDRMILTMVNSINLASAGKALADAKAAVATRRARAEAERYQQEIQARLGSTMSFHYIISGIGKDGTLGAFAPYTPELKNREPGVVVLKQASGALRVAINRGALINAERISLIVAGSLKLRALGRFEMEETADFEQTVLELSLIHISEPTRPELVSRMPSSA